ncbi:MAG TPA: ATP-binding protein, partial [Chitinophagaceae bacterium]|nr:ATP-binding protein [Chitinophagaceae bacterium]
TSLKIFGRSEKDLIGKKLLDVLPQMEGSKGHKDLLRAINGETIHNKVYYSEISNRYFENFLMPLKDENDNVYAVLVMAHDNTELIMAAEKLKEAQQIAQIGHWDWDVLTGSLTWSDNMYNIYGVDPQEGIDYERFVSLVHPDDRPDMQTNIEHALQTRTFHDFFHRIITPAGVEKVMHARGEVIVDKNGNVERMVGTGQDVTRQKKIEEQLMETNKKIEQHNQFIEQLINSSLDLIMVIDKDLRFITMNKKAQTIYKEYYKQDIIGKKITEVDPPVKGTESYTDLQQALAGKIVIKDKVKSTISDRYYEHNYIPLTNEHHEVYAIMLISHDITDNIRQMEELKKLSESDEQKNNFIAMASHELKTPITSIKGYVQLLLNALEKEKENKKPVPPLLVRSSLISVDKQIKRLTRLISELLDISKIETGTLELKKENFSLNELAIETVEDILYTNTKHRINLYHDFQSHVYGDKDRIGQVMINFLTNAIKYSPDSDKIDVTIHKNSRNEVSFSVRDYGIGIEKEEQKKIFERFYRAKGKAEQTYPGFGIGLFIAYEFIQKHGGQVWVESEKGKGSTFTFTLPILKEQ